MKKVETKETKVLEIKQDISGTPYFECTTELGTMAKVNLQTLKNTLAWVYDKHNCEFKISLANIAQRKFTADA